MHTNSYELVELLKNRIWNIGAQWCSFMVVEIDKRDPIGRIDIVAHDAKTNEAVLVMNEPGGWDGSDERLFELQERFNTYVSFLLDGELAGTHPELAGKRARIEVRCAHMPDARALDLLALIHDQLAFQDIKMEVVIRNDEIRMTNDEGMPKSE